MHQKVSINYDGFDPGTGHSTRAIQGLMERLKKQFITNAKAGNGAATATTEKAASDDNTGTEDAKPASFKKRGRPSTKVPTSGEKVKSYILAVPACIANYRCKRKTRSLQLSADVHARRPSSEAKLLRASRSRKSPRSKEMTGRKSETHSAASSTRQLHVSQASS